jgi:preprotein translocase SecE subunit
MMGLYKPGQGYWVRVLTAVGAGVLVLFGAVWGWGQAQAVRLPAKEWTMSTSAGRGDIQAGDTVSLLRDSRSADATGEALDVFGSAAVVDYRPSASGRADIVIAGFDTHETRDLAADTRRLVVGTDPSNPAFRATVDGAVAEPIFPQLYLQAGVAGGLILIGSVLIGWFVASSPKSSDFLIATDSEMKKVHWSTYKQIRGSTIVVIVATFLIAGFLFLIDLGFSFFFRAIDVLQS